MKLRKRMIAIWIGLMMTISACVPLSALAAEPESDSPHWNLESHRMTLVKSIFSNQHDSWVYELRHDSGATVVYKDNRESEKEFFIGFKTFPENDHGANHVLEHAVLCGSEKYPSRDIFSHMRSNMTAGMINAMTADDYTVYLYTVKNQKAFEYLADYMLDSVFYPRVLENEFIFLQQGIRLEYENGEIGHNGIVYNEINGRYNQFDQNSALIIRQLFSALFGDGVYNRDSAGAITGEDGLEQLTYQEIVDTHEKFYTPANCLVYISGEQDLEWTLSLLDGYFTRKAAESPNEEISLAEMPVNIRDGHITLEQESQPPDVQSAGVVFLGPQVKDAQEYTLFYATSEYVGVKLNETFSGNGAASVSGIGGGRSSFGYVIGSMDASEDVERKLNTALLEIADGAFDSAAISEITDIMQYGRHFFAPVMEGFLYADDPLCFMDLQRTMDLLNSAEGEEVVRKKIREYFVENEQRSMVTIVNGKTLSGVDPVQAEYTQEQIDQIKAQTEAYYGWVNTPESNEVLAQKPVLSIEDFRDYTLPYTTKRESEGKVEYFYTLADRLDDARVSLVFDLTTLDNTRILDAKLITDLLNSYVRQNNMAGISFDMTTYVGYSDPDIYAPVLVASAYAEDENDLPDILCELSRLMGEKESLYATLIEENIGQITATVDRYVNVNPFLFEYALMPLAKGHRYSMLSGGFMGMGTQNYHDYLQRYLVGDNLEGFADLVETSKMIFNFNQVSVDYVGGKMLDDDTGAIVREMIQLLDKDIHERLEINLPELHENYAIINANATEQIIDELIISGSVQHQGISFTPAMAVFMKYLETYYLYPQMRSLGSYGANGMMETYGGYMFNLGSIPDVAKAMDVLDGAWDYMLNTQITKEALDSVIISLVDMQDQWNEQKGNLLGYATLFDLQQYDEVSLLAYRQAILDTTIEDICRIAGEFNYTENICLFIRGNEQLIENMGIDFVYLP